MSRSVYTVELTTGAKRALKKIADRGVLRRIATALDDLRRDPRPPGAKALQGGAAGELRLRVGDYRIVYTVHDKILTVLVVTVGHRRNVYRRR